MNDPLADPLGDPLGGGPAVEPTANQLTKQKLTANQLTKQQPTSVAAAAGQKQNEDDWKRLRHVVAVAEQEESAVAGGGGAGDITADLELKHTQLTQACYGHSHLDPADLMDRRNTLNMFSD